MSDRQLYFEARDKVREETIFRRGQTKLRETKAQYARGDYVVVFGNVDPYIVVASGAEYVIALGYAIYEKRWKEYAVPIDRVEMWRK